eukprot:INCI2537.1.p1 GENE.INCI2537.1~~INCI2537.1.p1  ORF type:complete len:445 (+),score=76.25 INCI2537.1:145-1479(+)
MCANCPFALLLPGQKNTPPPLPKRQPVDSVTTSATMGTTTTTSTSTAVSNAENCFQVAGEGVAWWLCGCAGLVAGIVAVGGLTRLTRSGLSMVDWKPHGGLPPSGDEEWTVEFEKYKAFPEYQRSDKSMTLSDFKFIYFMEWGHRMLGRTVGLAFVLPAAVFAARGRLTGTLAKRCIGLGALGAAQGAIGWWMVKSGLAEDLLVNAHEPRVSPYRLTVHLTMAFSLYAGLVWTATDIFRATRPQLTKIAADVVGNADIRAALRSLSRRSHMAAGFIGLTVVAGALVAGNDAGRAFNDWPMYAERMIPEGALELEPFYRNFTENSGLVQFNHRNLAYASLLSVGATLLAARSNPILWAALPPVVRALAYALSLTVAAQAGLGICTLMTYVPTELGSLHQCGAVVLWTIALVTANITRASAGKNGINRALLRKLEQSAAAALGKAK